jgi:DUF177 domain-containing protein
VTTFNLRRARLRSGEQLSEQVEIELEPFLLAGQEYAPEPTTIQANLTITKATTGTVFELSFEAAVRGPCFRCLRETLVRERVHAREYEANTPGDDPDMKNEYLHADDVDLTQWARDAFVLQLPDKILHAPDCAGLCPVCGKDLNEEPHTHDELAADSRWGALDELRGQL